jgi:hypothetical protein
LPAKRGSVSCLVEEITQPESTEQIADRRDWDPNGWSTMISDYRKMVSGFKKVFRKKDDPNSPANSVDPAENVLGLSQL